MIFLLFEPSILLLNSSTAAFPRSEQQGFSLFDSRIVRSTLRRSKRIMRVLASQYKLKPGTAMTLRKGGKWLKCLVSVANLSSLLNRCFMLFWRDWSDAGLAYCILQCFKKENVSVGLRKTTHFFSSGQT